ncbi:hypothetical protein MNBD_NITROSPINAE04-808 [hydrothermal vent metagenome]|uniref:OmpA-like domain-containing protein n=1 Tax=hydrothermal vent metagenome TaxID=652676 RepID=A0A3B1BSF0_9ZZZZ
MSNNKRTLISFFTAVAVIAFSTLASAQVAIEGGSGLFYVQKAKPLGEKNIAVGAFYEKLKCCDFVEMDVSTLSVPLTVGLGDRLELSVVAPYKKIEPESGSDSSGIADGLARAKWNFSTIKKYGIYISGMAIATLPTGDKNKGLGTGKTNLGFGLLIDKEYEKVSWHANVGFLNRSENNVENQVFYGAGVEWTAAKSLGLIAEFSGFAYTEQNPGERDNNMTMLGARYYLDDWGSVEAGYASKTAGGGVRSPNNMFMAGMTIVFGKKPEPKPIMKIEPKPEAKPEPIEKRASAAKPKPEPEPKMEVSKPKPAPVTKPAVSIVLDSVYFKFDSVKLTDEAKGILKENAAKLQNNPDVNVLIEGNTCSIGPSKYNEKLGERRGVSVKLHMVRELNVDESRLTVRSLGETAPKYSNRSEKGRSLNRRVDFNIK